MAHITKRGTFFVVAGCVAFGCSSASSSGSAPVPATSEAGDPSASSTESSSKERGTAPSSSPSSPSDGGARKDAAGGATDAADAQACTLRQKVGECGDCMEAFCCAQANACLADPDCDAVERCRADCSGDTVCVNACDAQYAKVVAVEAAMTQCFANHCMDCINL